MDSTSQLEIKVIYDANASGRSRPAPTRRAPRTGASAISTRTAVAVIGAVNLLVALVGYYGAWWRVDRDLLYMAMMMHTPVPGMKTSDVEALFAVMSGGPQSPRRKPQAKETPPDEPPAPESPELVNPPVVSTPIAAAITGRTAQVVIVGGGYAWLALATIAIALLGLACGSCISSIGPPGLRRIAAISGIGLAVGTALYVVYVVRDSGAEYRPTQLRTFMGLLLAISVPLGWLRPSWKARACRLGGIGLIACALASSVGLMLWRQAGAITSEQAGVMTLVTVFAAISAWGWVLLALRRRLASR